MRNIIPEVIQPEGMQVDVAKELASLQHPSVPDWPGSPDLLPASPNKDGSPFKGHLLQVHLTQWTLQVCRFIRGVPVIQEMGCPLRE